MRPSDVLASVLLLSSACAASSAAWAPIEALFRRQDDNDDSDNTSFDLSFSATQGNTATTRTTARVSQTSDNESTATDGSDAEETGSGTNSSGRPTGTNQSGSATKTFDARLPAGGISMITPNALSTSYYKINDHITFAWDYTSVLAMPSAVDILVSCAKNQETYTLALNQTAQETQSFTWDTGEYQASATVLLLTETYTLIIHDAAKDASASPSPGYLGTFNQFRFGMYLPQPYTPIADYVCGTCSSAMSSLERQTYVALFGMAALTVLSFGWFTGVAGLW